MFTNHTDMKRIFILQLLLCLMILNSRSQTTPGSISGRVFENEHGHLHPLIGANVYWSGTQQGTVTDTSGYFTIGNTNQSSSLVVSFTGYKPDTIYLENGEEITVVLNGSVELEEVEVVKRRRSTELSRIDPLNIHKIGEAELEKAACCNLSESFETNPSVDVSFTDAITGTRQIQMLGLAGPYTQITRENIPDIRGLSAVYGMEYIPGPWIESIQLIKGTGSVANGFESIAGQINVELRKPETADLLYLNAFLNSESRLEGNLNLAVKLNEKWSTGLLLHGRNQSVAMDKNDDSFMDSPTGNQYILLNRWKYSGKRGWESQFGIKTTFNKSLGGQMGYDPEQEEGLWGMDMKTDRIEGWLKLGKVSVSKPYQSFGIQISGLSHQQEALFGFKDYNGRQQSVYGNFIFQSILGSTMHKYRTGASIQYDRFDENLDSLDYSRNEFIPGVFLEYTFSPADNLDIVSGMRLDIHSNYGVFLTPRLHIRYAVTDKTILRFSGGRGQRTASIFAENNSVLASSRQVYILGDNPGKPYGLDAETAWNFGTNLTQFFQLDYREGSASIDFYHTRFTRQVVVDYDDSPQTILFYNLEGRSHASSLQIQFDYELIRRLDMRLAYRWYDVQTAYLSGMKSNPLVAKHRAFLNLAYSTRNHWKFDYTLQWYGSKRLPYTGSNPEEYRLNEKSPDFFLMNAQVSKEWREMFEIYLGVENILNFRQKDPILGSNDPFGPYFDSSMVWGPVFGRMFYLGLRLKIR